ncbi:hypothetical protein PCANC_22326 [Puccinia coronata f. sp. avenae]|uniref:Uncharacterized protein n=1 Tax=Puccinia coronata f. sp. avenae TaxID=200324 RepID=A0A2N5S8B7_9BASI|nr:hypothetical protein PCANC_22326 [Puccinia coronata f. sp. avenae]
MLTFKSASRSLAFIEHQLGTRSTTRVHARCQHLQVYPLWTCEDAHHLDSGDKQDMINSEILEQLLDLFSDTVTTLDLYFLHPFSIRPQTIQAIGRMKGLKTLGLHGSNMVAMEGTGHPACFERLIAEAQGLKWLRLALPVLLPAGIHADLNMPAPSRYPAITHLELKLDDLSPEIILNISLAFRPSLKVLTLEDNSLSEEMEEMGELEDMEEMEEMDAELLRPIYETLQESIEGLLTNNINYFTSTHRLTFPKLRMLAVYGYLNSVIDVLGQEPFPLPHRDPGCPIQLSNKAHRPIHARYLVQLAPFEQIGIFELVSSG